MLVNTVRGYGQKLANLAENLLPVKPAEIAQVPAGAPKDWTVLAWLDGREGRAQAAAEALNRLEKVGTSERVNLVAQVNQQPVWRERLLPNMASLPTRRYLVTRDQEPDRVTSPVLGEGPVATGLAEFLDWGLEKFPARHTLLVVQKPDSPEFESELAAALQGRGVDVLALDSSHGQLLENAWQLRRGAGVLAGTPEAIKSGAWPYDTVAERLTARAATATPGEVGKLVVDAHRGQAAIHTAADLSRLEPLRDALQTFASCVVREQVAPELLYTGMASVAPMDKRSLGRAFDLRDLGTFLTEVGGDERFPASVREAAQEARLRLDGSLVAHYASPGRQELKTPTGFSTLMPWKAPTQDYLEQDWVRESGWGRLLDYIHAERPAPCHEQTPSPRQERLGLAQRIGKWALYQYKKYISPYLDSRCDYTPSCSQYAREAIETHGLVEGIKMGFLRLVSCDGHNRGPDPVPGHVCSDHCGCGQPSVREELLVAPPPRVDKSATRQRLEGFAVRAAAAAGSLAGGVALGALVAPFGAAIGAYLGYRAGNGSIDQLTSEMLAKHGPVKTRAYLNLARPVGTPGYKVHQAVESWTKSKTLAGVVGGLAGGVSGAVLGLAGSAAQAFNWGSAFGRLWAQNRTREALGELPVHPQTEAILKRDYE